MERADGVFQKRASLADALLDPFGFTHGSVYARRGATSNIFAHRAAVLTRPGADAPPAKLPFKEAAVVDDEAVMARVLSVDDSESIRALVTDALTEAGFEVFTAEDGLLGLEAARSTAVDIVLADVNMPNMGGIEMVAALRSIPGYAHTPIIMLTTEIDPAKKKQAKEAGATGWLVKPFESRRLIATIERILS